MWLVIFSIPLFHGGCITWKIFYENCELLATEQGQSVSAAVWSSEELRRNYALAVHMLDQDTKGVAPEGVQSTLKDMQKALKTNMNSYVIAIETELMRIGKIRQYKERFGSAMSGLFLSALITAGNYWVSSSEHVVE